MAVECNSQRSEFDRFRDNAPLGFHTTEIFPTSVDSEAHWLPNRESPTLINIPNSPIPDKELNL